jgi:hypothetical protein
MTRSLPAFVRLLVVAAFLATASTAHAQGGINLSWNDCGSFGTLNRTFACNTNIGSHTMVGSVVSGIAMPQLNGQSSVLDMVSTRPTLSPWWQIGATGCRPSSAMSADFDFVSMFNCLDPWGGQALGGLNYQPGFGSPNRARIRTVCAIPGSTAITGSDEYYAFKIIFTNTQTTGTGSCPGCTDPVCFLFNSIMLTQPAWVGDYTITTPISRNIVTWQSANMMQCYPFDPVRNTTWGSVKTLYR